MLASSPTRTAGFSSQGRRLPGHQGFAFGCSCIQREDVKPSREILWNISTVHAQNGTSCSRDFQLHGLALHFLSRCSAQQVLCHSLPLDVPPQREPDPRVHPSPAGMQHWLYPDRLQCLQKSPQDVQSIEAERRQCLGKREH